MTTPSPSHKNITNWGATLWRERRFCGDNDYAKHLRRIYWSEPASWFYGLTLRRLGRPYAAEVEAALRSACDAHQGIRYYWQGRLDRLDQAKERATPLRKVIANLQDDHWLERFLARHVLLHRGGEAIDSLSVLAQTASPTEQELAIWLILSIGAETQDRLAPDADHLLCSRCFVSCRPLESVLPERGAVIYYGCGSCGQSIAFYPWPPGGVVAVLDTTPQPESVQTPNQIRVNWMVMRRLFDFDQVEIINATDEDVERFVIQAGNDTDEIKSARYAAMVCSIAAGCSLSPNTMRILKDTFGKVEVKALAE
ncbi:MAG: hypothetical protein KDJ52_14425 [Anaerolineae bacterium]|nr:hypothetical protein [Anaerolineae bacterium]